MVFRHISEDMKQRAIWLLDHDLTIEQVGAILGVSESSIHRWKSNLEIHNSVIAPPSHTRGPHDVGISKSSLCQIIQDAGLTYKRLRKAATERDDVLRAEWMADISAHYVAQQIIVVDETKGYEACRVVPGSVDGEEFFNFILDDVLPKMNPFPRDRSIIILDNCAIHKTHALREISKPGSGDTGYKYGMHMIPRLHCTPQTENNLFEILDHC
ncbi:hypothetical protein C8J55DRAFT_540620 [Lentinula edodes]|uniref:Tc1-like transposase DDE domain-containing protein n=1 Tax=Lentinula lateritia TaxID=40482 RepID=A0A9W9AYC8_9AGAR|nr:hypothetical protein C8J55DRAFT_540620 [Lentinula edodes]